MDDGTSNDDLRFAVAQMVFDAAQEYLSAERRYRELSEKSGIAVSGLPASDPDATSSRYILSAQLAEAEINLRPFVCESVAQHGSGTAQVAAAVVERLTPGLAMDVLQALLMGYADMVVDMVTNDPNGFRNWILDGEGWKDLDGHGRTDLFAGWIRRHMAPDDVGALPGDWAQRVAIRWLLTPEARAKLSEPGFGRPLTEEEQAEARAEADRKAEEEDGN